jgi:hypothetical protein
MKLTTRDFDYINHRMDTYDIKYQEIYDEIKDHLIVATETARINGDQRNISDLFEEVVETQFPGYWAFEDISKAYEKAYRVKIRKAIWTNMKYYLDWRGTILVSILLVVSFYLPRTTIAMVILFIMLFFAAYTPALYVYFKSKVLTIKEGKQSLVKNHVTSRASFLMVWSGVWMNLLGNAAKNWEIPSLAFLNPMHYPSILLGIILVFFIIYGLSAIRLCKQEFKLADKWN